MEYHEFVCGGMSAIAVATADPDPAHIPGAAQCCCRHWEYVRPFRLGDGSHPAALDAAIRVRVAAEGYHIFPSAVAAATAKVPAWRTRLSISE